MGEHQRVAEWQAAQAVEFIRALRRHEGATTSRLAWLERQTATASNARAGALRGEAATLRRDIQAAQELIDRLERTYLRGDRPRVDARVDRGLALRAARN
ncbi:MULTISPECIES: hypothetical protein [unclassified Mycobacterium]|uniref:hypothetical protein n=1 Tax=unclassified Mycobacterium TaxID=2642494 RepID=UPI0012EA0815|nr:MULTISPECIES: hypothetical protein [unclassified Mycobacterium]